MLFSKEEKSRVAKEIKDMSEKHEVVGLLNMHKLPAKQLQQIREQLRGTAVIKMSRKTVMERGLDKVSKKGVRDLKERFWQEPALLFSNENPFRLFSILKKNRTPASAKAGDTATKDITIPAGPTGLPPGPAISTLQKVGLKTKVEGGKIAVQKDKVVCKEGETVDENVAAVLNLLNIEPLEIGLDLVAAAEGDTLYERSVLDIDPEDYIKNIHASAQSALNLSLNIGYITPETAPIALQKAFSEARSLCLSAGVLEREFIGTILAKAVSEAKALEKESGEKLQ